MSDLATITSDYVSDVLDEIALEGLDGITPAALWIRLSVRPNFCFQIDDNSKNFLWKIIISLEDVKFYEIPESRLTIQAFNPTSEDFNQNAVLELDSIYPYCKLKSDTSEFGSCLHYSTRVDITDAVIKTHLSEAEEKWGNKLVIVASQKIRNNALLGNFCTPNLDFTKIPVHYDILERIGRSRYLGLATCGKGSIQSVVEDPKSIFHYLKLLFQHKLIKKQALAGNLQFALIGSKVFLTRFYEECLNDNLAVFQLAIEELKTRPNYSMPLEEFNALFVPKKLTSLKKFKKSAIFKKFIRISKSQPYRTFYPNASQSEWEKKSKNGEKMVRCVQLINPELELADIIDKESEIEDEESTSGFLPRGIFYENMSILAQAYHHIKNSGSAGMSQTELVLKMGLNKRFVRGLIRRLTAEKYCQFFIENDGKKRCKRYIVGENIQTKEAASELVQILSGASSATPSNNKEQEESNNKDSKPSTLLDKLTLSELQKENISYRTLRRIGMIMKVIKTTRFRLFHQIVKYINEEEIKEGVTTRIDRITVNKLLQKLENDGLIKIINLTGPNKVGGQIFKVYAEPSFEFDKKQMETLYDRSSGGADVVKPISDPLVNLENELSPYLIENLGEMKKMTEGLAVKSEKSSQSLAYSQNELVYSPKFIRLNILHELLFYLVYEYTGIVGRSQEEMMEELSKTTAIDEDLRKEMPKLYSSQVSPYMFIHPLSHSGKIPGWFLISDILIRIPLSIVVKTTRVVETCPEFWKYLNHPIRKHYPIKDLPLSVRQLFFTRKNQIGYFYNEFRRLCFMGLIQYGPKFGREYFQTIVYLNRKASLLDTSTSPPAYYQVPTDTVFEVKSYYFTTKADVSQYWMDLFNICMGTNLGVKANMIGKEVLNERELGKESLKKHLEPKTVAKALEDDVGNLPGDNLGAGGLDSVMFSFLRSNWTVPINKYKEEFKKIQPVKMPLQKLKKEHIMKRLLLKKTRRRLGVIKSDRTNFFLQPEGKPKCGKFRKVKEREFRFKRRRKIAYDEIDLEALKLMNTLRVSWSVAEDNFLLICRVAMMYLCPNSRTFVRIPWSEVRRVLQENVPESKNKTQKAIARRIANMLKNPTTVRSVNLCLEELKQIPEAVDNFDCSQLLGKIKPSAPDLSELQNRLYEKFHELVAFLKDRFINNYGFNVKTSRDLIPDSLEEFLEKYQLEGSVEFPITIRTIREYVIRGILTSSLSCRADKTSQAVQLFDIYRQYNEDELQSAIKKLHADKVITVSKKARNAALKTGKILPLSFSPYKLSFAFQTMLNMKYTNAIYSDSFLQVSKLLEKNSEEEFEVNLNDCNITLFSLASKNFASFRTILPEQIIILDQGNLTDPTYSKMLERYCEMLRFSGSNSKVVCTSGKIISKSEDGEELMIGKRKKSDEEDNENEDGKEEEDVRAKKARLDVERGNTDERSEADDGTGEGENPDEAKMETGETGGEKDQVSNRTTRSSRAILYMMREEAKKEANNKQSGKTVQELCVVNASTVMGKIKKENLETYVGERGSKTAAVIVKNIINRCTVPTNLVDEVSFLNELSETKDVKSVKKILDFICSKRELGATVSELNFNWKGVDLSSAIKPLIESKIVLKAGIRETRFVSQKYSTPWLLNAFKMTRLEREKVKPVEITGVALNNVPENDADEDVVSRKKKKGIVYMDEIKNDSYVPPSCSTDANNKVKIIIRPWIRIDGSLNRKVLDRFLGTILSFVVNFPGTSIQDIKNRFSPQITPVWTKDLIEILFDIGCVTLTSLIVVEKSSLFSKAVVKISECYTGMEEDCFVAVEANVDAMTTLALFIGKKTYSKDFLVD